MKFKAFIVFSAIICSTSAASAMVPSPQDCNPKEVCSDFLRAISGGSHFVLTIELILFAVFGTIAAFKAYEKWGKK